MLYGLCTSRFCRHTVGGDQVAMDKKELGQTEKAPRPRTKSQVRSFLCLAGYYRKFIANFADMAVPLTDLTKKGQPNAVSWGKEQQRAFQELKRTLTQAPILRLSDFIPPFIIQTDASDAGVGAVLAQQYNDGKFLIAYASKNLLNLERNHSGIERECLAVIFGVKEFQNYVYGREFTLETDNQPLTHIDTCKVENCRIMRWALFLQPYRMRLASIKGCDNVAADYLSRNREHRLFQRGNACHISRAVLVAED